MAQRTSSGIKRESSPPSLSSTPKRIRSLENATSPRAVSPTKSIDIPSEEATTVAEVVGVETDLSPDSPCPDYDTLCLLVNTPRFECELQVILRRFEIQLCYLLSNCLSPLEKPALAAGFVLTPKEFRAKSGGLAQGGSFKSAAVDWLICRHAKPLMSITAAAAVKDVRAHFEAEVRKEFHTDVISRLYFSEKSCWLAQNTIRVIEGLIDCEDAARTSQAGRLAQFKAQFYTEFTQARLLEGCRGDTGKMSDAWTTLSTCGCGHLNTSGVGSRDEYADELQAMADARAHLELAIERTTDFVVNAITVKFHKAVYKKGEGRV
ncbi:hypothetical protein BOTBODRAFT_49668 [Botryobasidium botryosum FD-172 SS1]|uniref:Uncharacterized protein n=1 Tax=Botryobasidium botryosum (strain FD-172 SS1) TaxID=930990 RepID=A0A067LUG3_BOTB1|nr:hypothetical protein BOTBODRAFT_49668 [Botryobasidium botryosum FD-172 SS1]